jgi:hypothetical protein
MDDVEIESRLSASATEFLRSYTETVYTDFPGTLERISELGMEATYFLCMSVASVNLRSSGERCWSSTVGTRRRFRIPGEENDFTAIYQGLHILGEVRWFKDDEPMNGEKMREFLGKLDLRPQTIALFVSHSGLNDGAKSVMRRAGYGTDAPR